MTANRAAGDRVLPLVEQLLEAAADLYAANALMRGYFDVNGRTPRHGDGWKDAVSLELLDLPRIESEALRLLLAWADYVRRVRSEVTA